MKTIFFISFSFLLLSSSDVCQGNLPDQQSNPDLDFNAFLSGVKYASVVFNEKTQQSVDNGEFKEYTTEIYDYLKELGFEYIALTSEQQSSLVNAPSNCDIAFVYFLFDSEDPRIKNIQIVFRSCLGDVFTFNSEKTIKYDSDFVFNLSKEWRNLYFSKSIYSENARLKYPLAEQSKWNNNDLREHFDKFGCTEIEGIYEHIRLNEDEAFNSKYIIGVVKSSKDQFDIIYLGGAGNYLDWDEGEIKGTIIKTATPYFYSVNWIMTDKTLNEDVYCSIDENQLLDFVFVGSNKEMNKESKFIKLYPTANSTNEDNNVYKSGSAFAISRDGFIITNFHVIEGSSDFNLISNIDGELTNYNLRKVAEDKKNDIALLKIEDDSFERFPQIPFSIKTTVADVGEEVFALGYPLINSMGNELKVTDGIISSKSGFDGDITTYQISVPVQPGNSGGPLFDKYGNLLGIVSAKHKDTENVSYALKANYLKSFLESLSISIFYDNKNLLNGKTLTEMIKKLRRFVFIIKCK